MRRRLIELGLAMAAGAAGAGLAGARPAARTIEAKALYLVDDADRVRAIFGVDGDETVLSIRGTDGRPLVVLGTTDDGGTLSIRGRGRSVAGVAVGPAGTPRFQAADRDGRATFSAP